MGESSEAVSEVGGKVNTASDPSHLKRLRVESKADRRWQLLTLTARARPEKTRKRPVCPQVLFREAGDHHQEQGLVAVHADAADNHLLAFLQIDVGVQT